MSLTSSLLLGGISLIIGGIALVTLVRNERRRRADKRREALIWDCYKKGIRR